MATVGSANPALDDGSTVGMDAAIDVVIAAAPPLPSRPPRILCVDDEPIILAMLARALGTKFEVVTENDPLTALELVEHGHFSVIISDLRMPTMTGSTFLERVKSLSPSSTRLALTAGLDWQLPSDIAFGILTKPCPLPLLQATVAAAAQCHALLTAPPERPSSEAVVHPSAVAATLVALAASGALPSSALESGLRPRQLEPGSRSSLPPLGASRRPAPVAPPARLALALLGTLVELWPRATLLGRAMDCDIVVRDDRVAPRHLRFFSSWRGVTVQDVSGKGVFINGERLSGVRFIQPGDSLGLGPFDVQVRLADSSLVEPSV